MSMIFCNNNEDKDNETDKVKDSNNDIKSVNDKGKIMFVNRDNDIDNDRDDHDDDDDGDGGGWLVMMIIKIMIAKTNVNRTPL